MPILERLTKSDLKYKQKSLYLIFFSKYLVNRSKFWYGQKKFNVTGVMECVHGEVVYEIIFFAKI